MAYGNYTSKGNKQEDKYQNSLMNIGTRCLVSLASKLQESIDDAHDSTMVKYLSGDKTATTEQQFYEMIGKYPAFLTGWDFIDYYQNN